MRRCTTLKQQKEKRTECYTPIVKLQFLNVFLDSRNNILGTFDVANICFNVFRYYTQLITATTAAAAAASFVILRTKRT